MKNIIFILALVAVLSSCVDSSKEDTVPEPKNNASIVFGKTDFQFPTLSPPVREQSVHWGVLEDFFTEAKNINGSNYQALRIRSERLKEYSDSLFKNIPDTLDSKPINSRLLVLKTRAELLYQISHRPSIDSTDLQDAVGEMNTAVENFIEHLNEKFKKDAIDLQRRENEQRELKNQKHIKDSVMDLELRDKKER